jgi:hypothetical protein
MKFHPYETVNTACMVLTGFQKRCIKHRSSAKKSSKAIKHPALNLFDRNGGFSDTHIETLLAPGQTGVVIIARSNKTALAVGQSCCDMEPRY